VHLLQWPGCSRVVNAADEPLAQTTSTDFHRRALQIAPLNLHCMVGFQMDAPALLLDNETPGASSNWLRGSPQSCFLYMSCAFGTSNARPQKSALV
jgi:hypothetical protein